MIYQDDFYTITTGTAADAQKMAAACPTLDTIDVARIDGRQKYILVMGLDDYSPMQAVIFAWGHDQASAQALAQAIEDDEPAAQAVKAYAQGLPAGGAVVSQQIA